MRLFVITIRLCDTGFRENFSTGQLSLGMHLRTVGGIQDN